MALPCHEQSHPGPPVLKLEGISKRFGGLQANDAIDLELRRGEIVALLGENGAGKTTLMNILFGHYVADEGKVFVANPEGTLSELERGSPQAALKAGIGMVHQHFTLAENLTGFENVILGTAPWYALRIRRDKALARLQDLMVRTGLVAQLDVPVERLGVGERQRIEILKALYRDARILVLDEPTAVLTPQEADGLFAALRKLSREGLGVLFISHKLGEVLSLSDRIAVLRGGRKMADFATAAADRNMIARHMVGRDVIAARRNPARPGPPVLELSHVSAGAGRNRLVDASLTVRAGEIVGVAGVSGNGQNILAGLVAGLARPNTGELTILGNNNPRSPGQLAALGVGRMAEDRNRDGMVGDMSVAENLIIERRNSPAFAVAGFQRRGAIEAETSAAIAAFDVRCPGPDAPIRLLSGGNAQKLLLARALAGSPRLILANQPTRGLDIGASVAVHQRVAQAVSDGAGVLLISEDLDEVFTLSHRICVIHAGDITAAVDVNDLDVQSVGLAMAGQIVPAFSRS